MPPKKAESKPDEEYMSLSQVTDLIQQQKDMFMALLQQQQENFKGFVQIIMESTNTRLDAISKEIQEVKVSLQFTQKEVDDLKAEGSKQAVRGDALQADIYKICDSLLTVTDKMEYLEGQSRRNNLVFNGVAESPGETWADTEKKIMEILKEKLQLQHKVEVERAHRTGKPGGGDRPRPIAVKLLRYKDREAILQRAKSLRGTKIFINEDFTDAVRQKRKDLMPELRAAREKGDIAYLRYDKLIVHARTSTPK
ncbi:hypothetical protein ABVT39_010756 [Epinephelus coioides]